MEPDALEEDNIAKTIAALVAPYKGQRLTGRVMNEIDERLRKYCAFKQSCGVDVPQLTCVFIRGQMDIVRADLSPASIQIVIRNYILRFPDITPEEIVAGVRRAFPNYKNPDVTVPKNETELAELMGRLGRLN